jgi:hypothetical protein
MALAAQLVRLGRGEASSIASANARTPTPTPTEGPAVTPRISEREAGSVKWTPRAVVAPVAVETPMPQVTRLAATAGWSMSSTPPLSGLAEGLPTVCTTRAYHPRTSSVLSSDSSRNSDSDTSSVSSASSSGSRSHGSGHSSGDGDGSVGSISTRSTISSPGRWLRSAPPSPEVATRAARDAEASMEKFMVTILSDEENDEPDVEAVTRTIKALVAGALEAAGKQQRQLQQERRALALKDNAKRERRPPLLPSPSSPPPSPPRLQSSSLPAQHPAQHPAAAPCAAPGAAAATSAGAAAGAAAAAAAGAAAAAAAGAAASATAAAAAVSSAQKASGAWCAGTAIRRLINTAGPGRRIATDAALRARATSRAAGV